MVSMESKEDEVFESALKSAFNLFENEGKAEAALGVLKQAISADKQLPEKNLPGVSKPAKLLSKLEKDYSLTQNEALLSFLSKTNVDSQEDPIGLEVLAEELEDIRKRAKDALAPVFQELGDPDATNSDLLSTLEFNIALSILCGGDPLEGQRILEPAIQDLVRASHSVEDSDFDDSSHAQSPWRSIYCDMAFLFLECMVHASCGTSDLMNKRISNYVDSLFLWIGKYLKERESNQIDTEAEDSSLTSALHELKFRMHLYKSRALFLQGNTAEAQRQSKKEMKSAMELLQHKLRRPEPDNTSSEPSSSQQPSAVASKSYKNYNQIALYLKANSEHLKGNSKKALKLCAEANSVGEDFWNDDKIIESSEKLIDHSMHYNNLGLIHQSAGKAHLALYYYIQSLLLLNSTKQKDCSLYSFDNNGFVCPTPLAETYHNSSLCAAQAGKWESAYACMSLCTRISPKNFSRRARCWLLMSEACIGMHVSRKTKKDQSLSSDRASPSLPSNSNLESSSHPAIFNSDQENLHDMQKTKKRPLERALQCLHLALQQTEREGLNRSVNAHEVKDDSEIDCTERIFTCLCFVHLELRDPHTALQIALRVLNSPVPPNIKENPPPKSSLAKKPDSNQEESSGRKLQKAIFYCRREKVLLYSCEALCLLGQAEKALNLLAKYHGMANLSSGKNDATEWAKVAELMANNLSVTRSVGSNASASSVVTDTGAQTSSYLFLSGVHASAGNMNTSQSLARAAFRRTFRNSVSDSGLSQVRDERPESDFQPLPNDIETSPSSFLSSLLRKQEALNC